VADHAPLASAVAAGEPFVLLYCFEPPIMASPQHGPRHWQFVAQCLVDLQERGWPVIVWWGEVLEALEELRQQHQIKTIYAHQETGHRLSFLRDRAVGQWCRGQGIGWQEFVQDAVIRGRKHRRGFAEHVDRHLASPLVSVAVDPGKLVDHGQLLRGADFNLRPAVSSEDQRGDFTVSKEQAAVWPQKPGRYFPTPGALHPQRQPGGESNAWRYLRSFTEERGLHYAKSISSPSLSRRSCSRISTYLAWGCVSVRQVHQWSKSARVAPEMRRELSAFRERLWWRAHYYQKLEAEWQIERIPLNPAFLKLGRTQSAARLRAFVEGKTGLPMIDAAVRCLEATGWLNFRMRAMLATFATFTLWLDWRAVSHFLSSRFLDYDPGIHYGQLQMQAGLTGYHPPRTYNPYLQGEQKDPYGVFVHQWVPELRHLPPPFCHYPHRLTPMERVMYGHEANLYPAPIVDFAKENARNMERYWAVRKTPEARAALPEIWARHCLPENIAAYERGQTPKMRREA
jgi:deoxyribodipyrimidine photo-lyase